MKRIAVLLILCAAFISACTSAKWVRTNVAQEFGFNIALEQLQEKGGILPQGYDQPFEIDLSDLAKVMEDLKYIEERGLMGSEEQIPVFQAVEIDRLAPVLAAALAKADAGQRIRFTSFNQGKTLIFSVPRKTEGVLFVEPAGRLNIAFNFINAKRQPSEATSIDPTYSSVDPLNIKASNTTLAAAAPYAELHKSESGEPFPMWVVADLEKLKQSIRTEPKPVGKAVEQAAPADAPRVGIEGTPADKTAADQKPEVMPIAEIKNKLKFLKELLDEGLISEEDYTGKKMELLEKIK